jgi:hypothetical protein
VAVSRKTEKPEKYEVLAREIYVGGNVPQTEDEFVMLGATQVPYGETVELVPSQAAHYLAMGALGKPGSLKAQTDVVEENSAAKARISELEAELAKAKQEAEDAKRAAATPPTAKPTAK